MFSEKRAASADGSRGNYCALRLGGGDFGITLSTAVGTLYLLIRDRREKGTITAEDLKYSPKAMRGRTLMVRLLKIAIPISLGSIVVNVAQLIDTVTIIGRLDYAFSKFPEAMNALFSPYISEEVIKNQGAANFIYGSYSGYALSIFNLVPAFTGIFGKSALPNITAAWEAKKPEIGADKRRIGNSDDFSDCHSRFFWHFLFGGPHFDPFVSRKGFRGGGGVFGLKLAGDLFDFPGAYYAYVRHLQGLGRVDLPPKFMLVGVIVKFAANFFLIGIPSINVNGAAAGTFSCYFIIVILCFCVPSENHRFAVFLCAIDPKTHDRGAVMRPERERGIPVVGFSDQKQHQNADCHCCRRDRLCCLYSFASRFVPG